MFFRWRLNSAELPFISCTCFLPILSVHFVLTVTHNRFQSVSHGASKFHVISRRAFWIYLAEHFLWSRIPSVWCSLSGEILFEMLVRAWIFQRCCLFACSTFFLFSHNSFLFLYNMNKIFSLRIYFSVSHHSLVLAVVPITSSLTKQIPICISSSPQVVFHKFAAFFFNNWIICCVFLASNWICERKSQLPGMRTNGKNQ